MEGKRIYYVDCLRVFASFLVVLIHCNFVPENPANVIFTQALNVIGSPSSELFLAISGSLLLPVKTSDKIFYKKRFVRLLIPLLFWSLFGICWNLIVHDLQLREIPYLLFSIPFKSAIVGPYWFMYALVGMYLVAPIISPYIESASKKQIQFLLFLWCVTLIMPYTNLIYQGFYNTKGDFACPLYNFSGYLGYMILGFYLRKYPLNILGGNIMQIILLYLFTLLPIVFVGYNCPEYRELVIGNLQIISAVQVILVFTLFQKIFNQKNGITAIAQFMTNYTFGIYLIHVFVIDGLYKALGGPERYHVCLELPFIIVAGFVLSFIIVYAFSKIRTLKRIFGVNR
jgi:surface polysaccharide O-acyltransferase-like enzyme